MRLAAAPPKGRWPPRCRNGHSLDAPFLGLSGVLLEGSFLAQAPNGRRPRLCGSRVSSIFKLIKTISTFEKPISSILKLVLKCSKRGFARRRRLRGFAPLPYMAGTQKHPTTTESLCCKCPLESIEFHIRVPGGIPPPCPASRRKTQRRAAVELRAPPPFVRASRRHAASMMEATTRTAVVAIQMSAASPATIRSGSGATGATGATGLRLPASTQNATAGMVARMQRPAFVATAAATCFSKLISSDLEHTY